MYSMFKMIFGVWMIRYLYSPISLHDVQHSIFCVKCFVLQTGKFTIFNRCLGSVSEPNGSVTVPVFFLYFFGLRWRFPPLPCDLQYRSISQWPCSAPGSMREMPDSNQGLLPPKSGALPMSHHISLTQHMSLRIIWIRNRSWKFRMIKR